MNIFLWLVLSLIAAVLYRIGGSDLNIPLKTKWRDLGVPLVGVVCLLVLLPRTSWWWLSGSLVAYFMLSFGSLCTYWDHWGSDDVEWFEWMLTGMFYGLAAIPVAFYLGSGTGFVLRTMLLMGAIPFSNKLKCELLVEPFRGFMFVATLPLLVI